MLGTSACPSRRRRPGALVRPAFPPSTRPKANEPLLADFIVALTFPRLLDAFTPTGAFLWYSGCESVLSGAFFRVAETDFCCVKGAGSERCSSSSSSPRLATLRSRNSTRSSPSRRCATPSTSSRARCKFPSFTTAPSNSVHLSHHCLASAATPSASTSFVNTCLRASLCTCGRTRWPCATKAPYPSRSRLLYERSLLLIPSFFLPLAIVLMFLHECKSAQRKRETLFGAKFSPLRRSSLREVALVQIASSPFIPRRARH